MAESPSLPGSREIEEPSQSHKLVRRITSARTLVCHYNGGILGARDVGVAMRNSPCRAVGPLLRRPVRSEQIANSKLELRGRSGSDGQYDARLDVGVRRVRAIFAFAVLLGLTVALQWKAGAYRSELGSHRDESAHYVAGLLVHDYLLHHPKESPLVFAEQFYGHYPNVAIGYWPPLFYAVQGVWSLVFPPSIRSILFLVALISALLGTIVVDVVSRSQRYVVGMLAGILFVAIPVVVRSSTMIMADGLLSLLAVTATLSFLRFIDGHHRVRDS